MSSTFTIISVCLHSCSYLLDGDCRYGSGGHESRCHSQEGTFVSRWLFRGGDRGRRRRTASATATSAA